MSVVVRRYREELKGDWSDVLSNSKNGLFLFDRNYIEYHGDRFIDVSLVAYIEHKPVAVFPLAMGAGDKEVASHPGLTFGGVVFIHDIRGSAAIAVVEAFLDYLRELGVEVLTVKLLPQVFAGYPSAELDYVLWRRGFSLVRRDLSSVLPLRNPIPFNTSKRQGIGKAAKAGLAIASASAADFHELLTDVLNRQHGVRPVHSSGEMDLLMRRFPGRIDIYAAKLDDRLLAGAMVYKYNHIWHSQYLACSDQGRDCGALDYVVSHIKDVAMGLNIDFISFGTSSENDGKHLNEGLLWQKESFGARSITHDFMQGLI